jgi:hypothetical protein
MIIQKNLDFFKDMSAPTVSKTFPNAASDVLSLQIDGELQGGKIYIEGRNRSTGNWVALAGVNLSNFTPVRGVFTASGLYEIGVVGIREIRARAEGV